MQGHAGNKLKTHKVVDHEITLYLQYLNRRDIFTAYFCCITIKLNAEHVFTRIPSSQMLHHIAHSVIRKVFD